MIKLSFKYVPIGALVLLFFVTGQLKAGDVSSIYSRALTATGNYTAWSESDLTVGEWIPAENLTIDTERGLLLTANKKTEVSTSKSLDITANAILTYDFVWYVYDNNKQKDDGPYSSVKLSDNLEFKCMNKGQTDCIINGTSVSIGQYGASYLSIHVVINTATRTITALSVKEGETEKLSLSGLSEDQKTLNAGSAFNTLTLAANHTTTSKTEDRYTKTALKEIQIQQEAQSVTNANYTATYTYKGATVKTVTSQGVVGSNIPILTAFDGDGESPTRYVIEAETVPTQVIVSGESNTLNIPVRPIYQTTLKVYRTINGVQETEPFIDELLKETDDKVASFTFTIPYYIKIEGKYYVATLKGTDLNKYGGMGKYTTEAIERTVAYTSADDVVYFADFDDTGSDVNINCSNGSFKLNTKEETITEDLAAGTYFVTISQLDGYTSTLYTDNTKGTTLCTSAGVNSSNLVKLTDAITANTLVLADDRNMHLDYILIKKATVPAVVTTEGFATFSSDQALDFTDITTIKAYVATRIEDNGELIMTKVTDRVPAQTGLLLKGTKGTETTTSIPVVVDADAVAPTTNFFKASVTETSVAASTEDIHHYFLMNGAKGIGFYNLASDRASGAGKAYLETTRALNATNQTSPINMSFSDETIVTDISHATPIDESNSDIIYDLCGQKVIAPTKGLYIKNGQKIIIK